MCDKLRAVTAATLPSVVCCATVSLTMRWRRCPNTFHLQCCGLTAEPPEDTVWACPECVEREANGGKGEPSRRSCGVVRTVAPVVIFTVAVGVARKKRARDGDS